MVNIITVISLITLVISTAVIIHFEVLSALSRLMPRMKVRYRFRIAIGIFGALIAHTLEVWMFTFAYYFMIKSGDFGELVGIEGVKLVGIENVDLATCAYFSFITYTTLGYGDIVPAGDLRFLAGLEALTGLVLITWTASFMYYEMQKYWTQET